MDPTICLILIVWLCVCIYHAGYYRGCEDQCTRVLAILEANDAEIKGKGD